MWSELLLRNPSLKCTICHITYIGYRIAVKFSFDKLYTKLGKCGMRVHYNHVKFNINFLNFLKILCHD